MYAPSAIIKWNTTIFFNLLYFILLQDNNPNKKRHGRLRKIVNAPTINDGDFSMNNNDDEHLNDTVDNNNACDQHQSSHNNTNNNADDSNTNVRSDDLHHDIIRPSGIKIYKKLL